MKLYAKIKEKYLKEIEDGTKTEEYRQFESIVFESVETGRKVEYDIKNTREVVDENEVCDIVFKHPDVPWDLKLPINVIKLGKQIKK